MTPVPNAIVERPAWQRWGLAAGILGCALLLRHFMQPYSSGVPLATVYSAVALTVWFAGSREALAVMLAGYVLGLWLFLPGLDTWKIWEPFGLFRTLIYFLSAGTTVLLGAALRHAQRRHAESEARVVAILEHMDECFCVVDDAWRVTTLNRSAEKTLNLNRATATQRSLWELFPRLQASPAGAELRRALADRGTARFETDALLANGWAAVSASPSPGGLSIFFHDITEKKAHVQKLEAEVAHRTAALQETIADLEAFSYTLVHDMRAPLRSVRGFAALLVTDHGQDLPPLAREHVARIDRAALRMDRLIQDVLAYSQLGAQQPEVETVDLNALLAELLRAYPQFHAEKADITIAQPLPSVRGNEALLAQCFLNLLQNATKFVADGVKPQVRISAEATANRVRVCVADNGIGITPDARERIFEPFQREHIRYEGSGIGLAIVRKVLQRLNGKVSVDSEIGKGSRFWVDLERAR